MGEIKFYDKRGNYFWAFDLWEEIALDKAKIETIEKFSPPTLVKGIGSFLGHARLYRRFIRDFSKISRLLSNLQM